MTKDAMAPVVDLMSESHGRAFRMPPPWMHLQGVAASLLECLLHGHHSACLRQPTQHMVGHSRCNGGSAARGVQRSARWIRWLNCCCVGRGQSAAGGDLEALPRGLRLQLLRRLHARLERQVDAWRVLKGLPPRPK